MEFSFRQFLIESQTAIQFLKRIVKPEEKDNFVQIRQLIDEKIKSIPFTPKLHQLLVNFVIATVLKANPTLLEPKTHYPTPGNLLNKSSIPHLLQAFMPVLSEIRQWKDYLMAKKDDNKLMSRLNNLDFTPEMLSHESEEWHKELEMQAKGPGPEGQTIIALDHIGWHGWKWVSLNRGFCKQEGDAAGHCGNSSARKGDNILSLRDPQNYVRLTFIVNNKVLGESKGRGNDKPAEKYHPAILALLKSEYINTIDGGGYQPENNFELSDLPPAELADLKKTKPTIDYVDYVFATTDPKLYEDILNYNPIKEIKDGEIVFEEFQNLSDIYDAIQNRRVSDFSWADDPQQRFDAESPPVSDLIDYINRKNTQLITQMLASHLNKDEDDVDISSDVEEYTDLEHALQNAGADGAQIGTETEAHKYIQSELSSPTENGFFIDFKHHPYSMRMTLRTAKSILQDKDKREDIQINGLKGMLDFTYSPPYNGFSEFDKEAFNDRLSELLHELEPEKEAA